MGGAVMQKTARQIADEVLEKCAISLSMMDRALMNAEDRESQRIQTIGGTPLSAVEYGDVEDKIMRRAPRTNALVEARPVPLWGGSQQARALLTDPHGSSWLRALARFR